MSGENPILERDGTEAAFPYIGEDTNNDGKVDKVPSKMYGVNSNGDPVPLEVDDNNNLKTNLIEKVVIKGKDGENEIPVKVDNEGRLVLASDVNVETGDINIGTVEQGGIGEGAEPWEVKQTGSIEPFYKELFDPEETKTSDSFIIPSSTVDLMFNVNSHTNEYWNLDIEYLSPNNEVIYTDEGVIFQRNESFIVPNYDLWSKKLRFKLTNNETSTRTVTMGVNLNNYQKMQKIVPILHSNVTVPANENKGITSILENAVGEPGNNYPGRGFFDINATITTQGFGLIFFVIDTVQHDTGYKVDYRKSIRRVDVSDRIEVINSDKEYYVTEWIENESTHIGTLNIYNEDDSEREYEFWLMGVR